MKQRTELLRLQRQPPRYRCAIIRIAIHNKTGARQYTRAVLSIFAEINSTHPISGYIFLLSPTLGLPPRLVDALFGVTGMELPV